MKVNPVGKKYSEAEKAYLSGFLDADGAIMAVIERHKEKKFKFRVRIVIKISQKSKRVLFSLAKRFKVGKVVRNRETFDWIMRNQQENYQTLLMLIPYLRVKSKPE